MKIMKKLIVTGLAVLTIAATPVTAFAASQYGTPAEAVAGLTGRDVQTVIDEKIETGKTYGTIANEAGVLDEFQAEMTEIQKDTLAARVANGTMTQEQADAILQAIEENRSTCDGTGNNIGRSTGASFGMGGGQGRGAGQGRGLGQGGGQGQGLRDGSGRNN